MLGRFPPVEKQLDKIPGTRSVTAHGHRKWLGCGRNSLHLSSGDRWCITVNLLKKTLNYAPGMGEFIVWKLYLDKAVLKNKIK